MLRVVSALYDKAHMPTCAHNLRYATMSNTFWVYHSIELRVRWTSSEELTRSAPITHN